MKLRQILKLGQNKINPKLCSKTEESYMKKFKDLRKKNHMNQISPALSKLNQAQLNLCGLKSQKTYFFNNMFLRCG